MILRKQIMYSSAYFGIALLIQSVVNWYGFYYAPPEGNPQGLTPLVPIGLVGIAMIIGRIVDAFADPLVAYWSDNTHTKRGRRIPFIMFGAIPLGLSFILIWFPITPHTSTANFVYLCTVISSFFFFFTVVVAPYLALLPEIVKSSKERVKVSSFQAVANILGLISASVVAGFLIHKFGYKAMGLILGILGTLSFFMPVLSIREEPYIRQEKGLNLFESITATLKNRNFVFYLMSTLMFWFSINILSIATPYIVNVLMGLGEKLAGVFQGIPFMIAIFAAPLINKIAAVKGKKYTMSVSLIAMGILFALLYFIGMPYPVTRSKLYGFTIVGILGIPLSALFIIPNAIVADITDTDYAYTGQKREAMFFGVQGLFTKAMIGFSSWFTLSVMFAKFGYSIGNELGIRLAGPIAGIAALLGAVFLKGYKLD